MKRTTVKIPDDLDRRLRQEAERRGTTISEITREALGVHLGVGRPILMSLAGSLGGGERGAAERLEEILATDIPAKLDAEAREFRS